MVMVMCFSLLWLVVLCIAGFLLFDSLCFLLLLIICLLLLDIRFNMSSQVLLEIANNLAGLRRIQVEVDLLLIHGRMHLQTLKLLCEFRLEFFDVLGVAVNEHDMLRFDLLDKVSRLVQVRVSREADVLHGHVEWYLLPIDNRLNRLILTLHLDLLRQRV